MTKSLLVILMFVLSLFSCKDRKEEPKQRVYNPCADGHDTTFHISFAKDSSITDFYQLLDFIESKGEFSRFNRKHKTDSSLGNSIILQKMLCEDKDYESPMETWSLDNIFSIHFYMTSGKPVKGEKFYFPTFDITQYNFKTESEKTKAYLKIKEIGWGDPLKKWNDYYIITSNTRIIVLESRAAIFSDTKNRYGKMIQKEWVDKSNQ